jgi:hypothetical protein
VGVEDLLHQGQLLVRLLFSLELLDPLFQVLERGKTQHGILDKHLFGPPEEFIVFVENRRNVQEKRLKLEFLCIYLHQIRTRLPMYLAKGWLKQL